MQIATTSASQPGVFFIFPHLFPKMPSNLRQEAFLPFFFEFAIPDKLEY